MEPHGRGIRRTERWKRNAALSSCLPTELWPTVHDQEFNAKDAEKFRAYKEAVTLYVAGETCSEIQQRTGVHRSYVVPLIKRCLELASDGRIFGFRALIPHIRVRPNRRNKPLGEKRRHQHGGQTGALGATLARFPDLQEELLKLIRSHAKNQNTPEFRIAPKTLHRIFIRYLKDKGVSDSEWPFNTQYHGVRSIQKYMRQVINDHFAHSVNSREESPAKAHLQTGTGVEPFLRFSEPYDAVEIDAYKVDSFLTVAFKTPEGTETDLLLERLWLIAIVERASTAVLAYSIVYRSEVTSDDVVHVIRDAVCKRWVPKNLTLPMKYPPNGGLPSGVIPEAYGACWSVTLLDGALAHLSKSVREKVRRKLGFVISWGASGHFERRPNVERMFGDIAKDVFKRLPSTTGANPYNGRAKDAEKKAVRYKIRAAHAEEMVDIYVAQHNGISHEGISSLTPIEVIRYFLDQRSSTFILRQLPMESRNKSTAFGDTEMVTVRGGLETGRRPYIQLDRVHYTSPVLRELGNLIGQTIIVEIDEEDYRQVKAYLRNGAELGFLTAQGRWAQTKHSRRVRKAINSLITRRIIALTELDDPVLVYLGYLSTPKNEATKNGEALTPRQVTDATRVSQEAGVEPRIAPKKMAAAPVSHSTRARTPRHSLLNKPAPVIENVKNRK